ncbi:21821_t:CDS:2 [Dentiscutata erythropus]|uniref:21821_t:CDS:1 n=1 Tax=Dentiscutata erythropus TaxID=1348616 RepID=A0A9N9FKM0_9GLOM|nr:21821_t:CDS:2 [Dentiscutata erythropus]
MTPAEHKCDIIKLAPFALSRDFKKIHLFVFKVTFANRSTFSPMPQEQKQKKKRVPITALTKQEICIKKRENMKLRDEDLAKEYGLDRSTITKILKQRDKWLAIDPNSNYAKQKTQKSPKFPQIEEALAQWLTVTISQGNAVSDGQLQEKALEFAQMYGLRNEFQASNGWISKFKNRHQVRSGDSSGAPDVSLQIPPQSVPITGTVLSPPEHSNYSSTVSLPPTSNYTTSQSITSTSNRTNGTNALIGSASSSPYIFGASTSNSMGPHYIPSRIYPVSTTIAPHIPLENAAFIFCDYQNDVIGMFQTSNTLNQFLTRSKQLFTAVHQAQQKKNISCFSVGLYFRPGYPEVSPNNRHFENLKSLGRLVDGTKGAEFIDGMVPRDNDIVIQKRRTDAFYNTDLQMILESRNIHHIILSGIATGDVILSTTRSAADRDMSITVVRDCCFDGSDMVQNVLMDEIFPKQGVMVVSFEEIVNGLRSI